MDFPVTARLIVKATGKTVVAEIRPTLDADLLLWLSWSHEETDQDQGWDWEDIFEECQRLKGKCECYSILAQGELQGLMALDLREAKSGKPAGVLVDYLATNPANRTLGQGLKNVGVGLISVALQRSIECGMAGQIWLESLSGAEGFYGSLGMTKLDHKSENGYSIYVLDAASSEALMEEIRAKGVVNL